MRSTNIKLSLILAVGLACLGPAVTAQAEITMKLLIVNPSETEVKEFRIRSPLPPEVKPEHVLDADGLKVEYDSQAATYFLVGTVTLKPKESMTRKVVLDDVWVIPSYRVKSTRHEIDDITRKLVDTPYAEQGRVLASAIERNLATIEGNQEQPFLNPQQHISRYRDDLKTLQLVESDLVSLRQLMVMAALRPSSSPAVLPDVGADHAATHERGSLSILATWRLIFIVLGLLGFVSLSFFLVWQRQLKQQLAKQALREDEHGPDTNGHDQPPVSTDAVPPTTPSRLSDSPFTPLPGRNQPTTPRSS